MTAIRWWDDQAPAVRAVLDLADLRADATSPVHDNILALFARPHADEIERIARNLDLIERAGWDEPTRVMSDYHGFACSGDADACDVLADRLRADVLFSAQIVASMLMTNHLAVLR